MITDLHAMAIIGLLAGLFAQAEFHNCGGRNAFVSVGYLAMLGCLAYAIIAGIWRAISG